MRYVSDSEVSTVHTTAQPEVLQLPAALSLLAITDTAVIWLRLFIPFLGLFIIYLLLNRTESTHTHKRREKEEKNPLTIKHHTLGLVSAQKTNNVIYSITEITR